MEGPTHTCRPQALPAVWEMKSGWVSGLLPPALRQGPQGQAKLPHPCSLPGPHPRVLRHALLSHLLQWECRQGWGQGLDGPISSSPTQQSSASSPGPQGRPDQSPCQSITLSPGVTTPFHKERRSFGHLGWRPRLCLPEAACLAPTSIPCADPYAHKHAPQKHFQMCPVIFG